LHVIPAPAVAVVVKPAASVGNRQRKGSEIATLESSATRRRPAPLWRNRDFVLLWSGQTVSAAGTEVALLAYPLLVLALTHSPAQAGFVGALRSLPYAFLCLPVGALVDRWDRKRVMILCDSGCAIALGSIPLAMALGRLTLAQIYVVALLEGILYVFFNLANTACLPRIVSPEQLPVAVSRNYVAFNLAFLLGPLAGGALFAVSHALPFLVDALSFGVSALATSGIRVAFQAERTAARRPLRVEIGEGLSWLWRRPLIRFLMVFISVQNLLTSGMPLIVIVLAQRQHASSATVGVILAVAGVGGIGGALVAPLLQRRFGFGRSFLAALWLFVLAWPLLALAPSLAALALAGAAILLVWNAFDMVQFSYRLRLIPDALQGRVNSVYRLGAYGGQSLGLALAGVLLEQAGPGVTIVALGIGLLGLTTLMTAAPYVRAAPPQPKVEESR
jgi:MFS family permease